MLSAYSWLSMALDLAQMVLEVRKNLKQTQFYLLNKLSHNNFAQNLSQKTKGSNKNNLYFNLFA